MLTLDNTDLGKPVTPERRHRLVHKRERRDDEQDLVTLAAGAIGDCGRNDGLPGAGGSLDDGPALAGTQRLPEQGKRPLLVRAKVGDLSHHSAPRANGMTADLFTTSSPLEGDITSCWDILTVGRGRWQRS